MPDEVTYFSPAPGWIQRAIERADTPYTQEEVERYRNAIAGDKPYPETSRLLATIAARNRVVEEHNVTIEGMHRDNSTLQGRLEQVEAALTTAFVQGAPQTPPMRIANALKVLYQAPSGAVPRCKVCNHPGHGNQRCVKDAPNAQFRCACTGLCAHGKVRGYCRTMGCGHA